VAPARADPDAGSGAGVVYRGRRRLLHPLDIAYDPAAGGLRPGGRAVADGRRGGVGHFPESVADPADAHAAGGGLDE